MKSRVPRVGLIDGVGVGLGRGVGEGLVVRVIVGEGAGVEVGIGDGLGVWVSIAETDDGVSLAGEVKSPASVRAGASGDLKLQADIKAATIRERQRYKNSLEIFIDAG